MSGRIVGEKDEKEENVKDEENGVWITGRERMIERIHLCEATERR
jgi:hypothetical protein